MKKARVTYSIDWMQLFCSTGCKEYHVQSEYISPNADRYGNHHKYVMAETRVFIKGYNHSMKVIYKKYDVATIAWSPKDERRRKDGAAIKINNAVLYNADWYFFLHDILQCLGWQPINITRVDICADFNFFLGGLSPETFLRKYVCKQRQGFIRVGSNAYNVYGKKDMYKNSFESIRWGSRQNGVSVYMYNKSKELKEVHDKPWIKELWKRAELSSTKDVWRVEISITSQGLGLKDLYNSTIHTLFTDDLKDADLCASMFKCYAAKHFRFLRLKDGVARKRDLEEVALLDVNDAAKYRPISLCENHETGRMDRIVSNKLEDLYEYVLASDIDKKYEELKSLDRTINIFNYHHNLKERVEREKNELINGAIAPYMTIYGLHKKEDIMQRVGQARRNIEDYLQRVRKAAERELIEPTHAQVQSPPPQAKRGGIVEA